MIADQGDMHALSPEDAKAFQTALRPFALHQELREAVGQRDLAEVNRLLGAGASPNMQLNNRNRLVPIQEAAGRGFIEGMEVLHAAGAEIDILESANTTALMTAAYNDEVEAGRWLLRHGADARLLSTSKESALYLALSNGYVDFATMMLEERPDLCDDDLISTAKLLMSATRDAQVVRWLLNAGVTPDLVSEDHIPWLVQVCVFGQPKSAVVLEMLLNAGANPNLRNRCGETALHKAVERQSSENILRLLRAGADPDVPDRENVTPRWLLMNRGNEDVAKMFKAWEASNAARQIIDQMPVAHDLKIL